MITFLSLMQEGHVRMFTAMPIPSFSVYSGSVVNNQCKLILWGMSWPFQFSGKVVDERTDLFLTWIWSCAKAQLHKTSAPTQVFGTITGPEM